MADETKIEARNGEPTIRVLAASALRSMLTDSARAFNAETGAGFDIQWGTSGAVETLARASAFDIAASARDALRKLAQDNICGAPAAIGRSRLAVGIKAGSSAPDVSSVRKFRDVLLSARMISRGDPAGGGTAGNHLVGVFERMGVMELVAAKSILRAGGFAVIREVVEGNADFGLTQSTEIPAVEGAAIGGYLPLEVQLETTYAAAASPSASEAAQAFMSWLTGEAGKKIASIAGFAPV